MVGKGLMCFINMWYHLVLLDHAILVVNVLKSCITSMTGLTTN